MYTTKLGIAFLIITILLVGYFFSSSTPRTVMVEEVQKTNEKEVDMTSTVTIGSTRINVSVADTAEERTQGLSGRENLPENEGLLFIFEKSDRSGFWMKDMNFAIDIIWIDEQFSIIDIKENATPESYPEIFYPKQSARYVLEVPSGTVQSHNIKIGDKATFSLK
jgi:uncharacterized protein